MHDDMLRCTEFTIKIILVWYFSVPASSVQLVHYSLNLSLHKINVAFKLAATRKPSTTIAICYY